MIEKPIIQRRQFPDQNGGDGRKNAATLIRKLRKEQEQGRITDSYFSVGGHLFEASRDELLKRANGTQMTSFLDAGAGLGGGVEKAGKLHPKIRAFGLSIKRPPHIGPEKWITGTLETTIIPNHFDVIQSEYSLEHSFNLSVSLENLLNSLRSGGHLIARATELKDWSHFTGSKDNDTNRGALWDVMDTLEEQGFRIKREFSSRDGCNLIRIVRGIKKADLSEFYFRKNSKKV
ncbi:MAG: hypothetical protein ABH863_03305 [Candidatus Micrarchaeota archaeon]